MLAERLLTAGLGRANSLEDVARKYQNVILDKSTRELFIGTRPGDDRYLAPRALTYAALDALIMFGIWRQQAAALKKERMTAVADLEFACLPAVAEMELAGVRVDPAAWRRILVGVAIERDRAAEELTTLLAPASRPST
jgi:DNA polymerase-1